MKLALWPTSTSWFEGLQVTAPPDGGWGPLTETVVSVPPLLFVQTALAVPLEQLILNSVVCANAGVVQLPLPTGVRFILFHPVEPPSDPVQDVALVEDQVSVAVPPEETCVGDAFKLHESVALALTVYVMVFDMVPSANSTYSFQVPASF